MKYDIFLVDVDDTVLDFHSASAAALKRAFEENGVLWEERFLTEFKAFNAGLWERLERKEITRSYLMENRFHLFLQKLGLQGVSGEEFNCTFLTHLATTPIYLEGAKEFLQTIRKRGRVYFVTNGTAWIQKSRFDIAELWGCAEETFVSDLIGHDKPSEKFTQYVIERIEGFSKERAVWIGDSLSSDILAANQAGIDSVWFTSKGNAPKNGIAPTYIAHSYREILSALGIT